MSNKNTFPSIRLRKLVLVGVRKEYIVNFKKGLNIIYGDSDTGKSSILNLIDYSLGAKAVYVYPEIQATGKYSLLELVINGKVYTIKRDIFDGKKEIEVYSSAVENMNDVFPKVYYSNYSKKNGELEYFSDFLLDNLGIANVKVKKSPSKENSEMTRLSFRDVFKYCYLNQDSVGSRNILDSNDWILRTKNQEVFKYIFNLLDSNIAQVQSELAEARIQRDELIKKHKTISSFLRETQLENYDKLISERLQVDEALFQIQQDISKLNIGMISNSEDHDQLRNDIGSHDIILQDLISQNEVNERHIRNNIILKKDYIADIQKIQASLEVIDKVAEPTSHSFFCPLCATVIPVNGLKAHFEHYDKASLEVELKNLKKRLREIDSLIQNIREENEEIQLDTSIHKEALKALRQQLDSESKQLVSPFVTQLEKLVGDKAALQESKKYLGYRIKVRGSLEDIDSQNIIIDNKMTLLREQIALLKDSAPTVEGVLEKLADYLSDFLKYVRLKQSYGISINSKLFLPIVRNTQYIDLTSGGVRTLVSIGYILTLLMYALENKANHPKLVMIDTVGKYLGKTSPKYQETDKKSDVEEGITISDASKYTEMYKYFVQLDKLYSNFQLIVVDNDLPSSLEDELQQYVVKHFDENSNNGSPRGFIDDASDVA